jgi:hypothetical protein
MPNITLLPTITSATNATTFVVVDNRLTRRINYTTFKTQLAADLLAIGFKGDTGSPGSTGTNGVGVVAGGTAGQVLAKINETNYNTHWISLAAVSTTGNYSSLIGAPAAYTATSINVFLDVDTATTPPTNGQALVWNSSSSTWKPATVGAGIGLSTRTTVQGTTAISVTAGATENCQAEGFKSYLLSKLVTNYPAWVRIYTDATSRTADASRTEGNDPTPGSGIIAEVITTSGALTQLITPGVIGFNNDSSTTSTIYLAVTNKDVSSRVITVNLTLLQLEN